MTWMFYALGALAVLAAANVVLRRHPVHATLWLVVCFVALAGVYATLGADLLAVVQVFVYAGAIVVLFLFVVMLVGHRPDERVFGAQAPLGAAVALALSAMLAAGAARENLRTLNVLGASSVRAVADALLGPHALAFEVASVLLLAALVASVVVSRAEE